MNHPDERSAHCGSRDRRMQRLARALTAPLLVTAICVPIGERTTAQDDERGIFEDCDPTFVPMGQLLMQSKGASFVFGTSEIQALPADFFAPGSLPFTGSVDFIGIPINPSASTADTSIMRHQIALVGPIPSTDTVDIELVQLSLASPEPIEVDYGTSTELWDVAITLAGPQPMGSMTITRTHVDGGEFDADLPVCPLFTFTRQSDQAERTYDPCGDGAAPLIFRVFDEPWIQSPFPDPEPARSDCMYLPAGYNILWETSDLISPCAYLGCQATGPTDCNLNESPDQQDILDGISFDVNLNWIPDECECPGDVRGVSAGAVDVADLLALLGAWGPCPAPCPPTCPADVNLDCVVDVLDLLLLLGGWGPCPVP